MLFLVDESAGFSVSKLLRDLGHDVLEASQAMPAANDSAILTRALQESRIIVTNDKDFGELIFRSGQAHAGVGLLRLRDENSANRIRVLRSVLDRFPDALANQFIVASDRHIRIRRTR